MQNNSNGKPFSVMAKPVGSAGGSGGKPFSVMAKPVGSACNLACGYCYYKSGKGASAPRMSAVLLEEFVRQYIAASPGPEVFFTWHGGEPTLAGLDFYRLAVELQKKYAPEGWSCVNNLQTNGLALDDEWCAFLSEARFDVGLSLDGYKRLHDSQRKDPRGGGSYDAAAAAARRLQASGVQPDLLCTVTSQTAAEPEAVFRALMEMDTGWIQFIPIVRIGPDGLPAPDSVSAEAYGGFLCAVFDEWVRRGLGRCGVQLFAETARVLSGGSAGLCWMAPSCGGVLILERDGSVYSCDHYVRPEHKIGDIFSSDLRELANLPEQIRFGEAKRDGLPEQCRTCRWLALCNGGCPKDRFGRAGDVKNYKRGRDDPAPTDEIGRDNESNGIAKVGEPNSIVKGSEPGLNRLCAGLKRFFAHAEQPLKTVAALSNEGYKPAAISQMLLAESKASWKGTGRNDPCPCGSGKKAKNCCMKY